MSSSASSDDNDDDDDDEGLPGDVENSYDNVHWRSEIRRSDFHPHLWPGRQPVFSIKRISQAVWGEPHLMENMVGSRRAAFMTALRYIFLTEWQRCAKHCGSAVPQSAQGTIKATAYRTRGPLHPKDRGKDFGTPRSFSSSVASEKNCGEEDCHFSWQEQDCNVSSWTKRGMYDPWSNRGRLFSTDALGGPSVCQKNYY